MTRRYSQVLQPLDLLGGLRLRHRVFFAPMGVDLADHHGCFTPEMFDFYRGIIEGGCALAFLSNATVSPQSRLQEVGLGLFDQRQVAALKPFLAWAESEGTPVGVQLQHYGGQGSTRLTGSSLLTQSGVPCPRVSKLDPSYRVRIMDEEDIAGVIADFSTSACLAQESGARLVQLQASNGYLLSSFLSPHTNRRTDCYGGSEANRARLLLEVVEAIHRSTGGRLIVTVRLGIDDCLGDEGLHFTRLEETVQALERAGVAALECSMCVGSSFGRFLSYSQEMDRYLQDGVSHIKSQTRLPVGYAGFVEGLDKAEDLLARGVCDWVGMSRALFADNDLIRKELAGRAKEVHRCLWDGKCFGDKSDPRMDRVYCCVNPKYPRPQV